MFRAIILYIAGTVGIFTATIVVAAGLCAIAAVSAIAVYSMLN